MPDPMDTARLVEVADRFWVRNYIDNIAWLDCGGFAVAVDALEEAHLEGEVFGAIDETLHDTPVRYLLNTHTHYDHVALNDAFRRRGAEIINLEAAPVPDEGRWLEGDRRRVLFRPLPNVHTPTDCIVWVPQDRVLFTGDLFGWGLIPLTRGLRSDTAGLLLETYSRLIEFDAATVIPGHGPLCDTDTLKRFVTYFVWLVEGAHQAVAEGAGDEEIAQRLAPPEDMRDWWRFTAWKHDRSLRTVLTAVRSGRLAPEDVRRWQDAPPWA